MRNKLGCVFTFDNIPNRSYILVAENKNGSASTEITVFNGKVISKGESQACEAIFTNIFRHERARVQTENNRNRWHSGAEIYLLSKILNKVDPEKYPISE